MNKAKVRAGVLLLFILIFTSGCNFDAGKLLQVPPAQSEDKLFKAEITFDGNDKVIAYIKSLGVEEDGEIYIGGASLNYLYDVHGNIIGSYNYQRVLHIKIIPENKEK